jgi:hypothetical protein
VSKLDGLRYSDMNPAQQLWSDLLHMMSVHIIVWGLDIMPMDNDGVHLLTLMTPWLKAQRRIIKRRLMEREQ